MGKEKKRGRKKKTAGSPTPTPAPIQPSPIQPPVQGDVSLTEPASDQTSNKPQDENEFVLVRGVQDDRGKTVLHIHKTDPERYKGEPWRKGKSKRYIIVPRDGIQVVEIFSTADEEAEEEVKKRVARRGGGMYRVYRTVRAGSTYGFLFQLFLEV
jgi:hypothetical protein